MTVQQHEAGQENEKRRKRALYRAGHRGTKELDILLGKFAQSHIATMTDAQLALFEEFLLLPEPMIDRMIMSPESEDCGDFIHMIDELRRFHGLDSLES